MGRLREGEYLLGHRRALADVPVKAVHKNLVFSRQKLADLGCGTIARSSSAGLAGEEGLFWSAGRINPDSGFYFVVGVGVWCGGVLGGCVVGVCVWEIVFVGVVCGWLWVALLERGCSAVPRPSRGVVNLCEGRSLKCAAVGGLPKRLRGWGAAIADSGTQWGCLWLIG